MSHHKFTLVYMLPVKTTMTVFFLETVLKTYKSFSDASLLTRDKFTMFVMSFAITQVFLGETVQ